ncbi:phospholipase A2-like isoform X3 [Electrophorus electricus]|uniref:phospholipase A2-like isoform X3 n=1 Tax=Electrophorus electricus TaxID=8005 RepID=UPI000F0A1C4C|nr:phospholipase A2-like isoform X3 [Electrophorus electricus]
MTVIYIATLFFLSALSPQFPSLMHSGRDTRSLLELAGVIKCSTGRSAVAYVMYGCYCGIGGQGWPRDKADWISD